MSKNGQIPPKEVMEQPTPPNQQGQSRQPGLRIDAMQNVLGGLQLQIVFLQGQVTELSEENMALRQALDELQKAVGKTVRETKPTVSEISTPPVPHRPQ